MVTCVPAPWTTVVGTALMVTVGHVAGMTVTCVLASWSYAALLPESRTQTPKFSVPGAAPVLFQWYWLLVEYAWSKTQVVVPVQRAQNSYRALAQPVATAVSTICVPDRWGEAGEADRLTVAHAPVVLVL